MPRRRRAQLWVQICWWAMAVLSVPIGVVPQRAHAAEVVPLRVGTKESPPFVVRREDGTLDGPSIRLWRELAEALEMPYAFEERSLEGLLAGVEDGSLDVAIAAITVTSQRERTMDFTHPYHTAGLAIVTHGSDNGLWIALFETLVSRDFLELVLALALIQLLVGAVVWRVERGHNPDQFPKGLGAGLFSGFWWSVVTMTTVGYGDKTPRSGLGRVVALGWMLCSVVVVSAFTATVASRMTLRQIESEITGPRTLDRVRVGVVAATTSERWARAQGLDFRRFDTLDDALHAVRQDAIDALVHDAPLLERALDQRRPSELRLLSPRFQRQDYAIALPQGSGLREPINRLLPEKLRNSAVGDVPSAFEP